jgi:hypothetical protein
MNFGDKECEFVNWIELDQVKWRVSYDLGISFLFGLRVGNRFFSFLKTQSFEMGLFFNHQVVE